MALQLEDAFLCDMLFRDKAIISLESVDSTNNYAANLIRLSLPPEGTVITAQVQTEGKGQRLANWESNEGENLLCSFILYPKFLSPEDHFAMSQAVSLAIREVIETITQSETFIKWPNDIFCLNKKISGILIENSWNGNKIGSSIVGIGVNVNQDPFENRKAISIRQIIQTYYDVENLLVELIDAVEKHYFKLKTGHIKEINQLYQQFLFRRGIPCQFIYDDKEITATIQGVDQHGRLRLLTSNNIPLVCNLKEISMII